MSATTTPHFITLEDEFGMMNVIVRPSVYARYRRVIRSVSLLLISGEMQHEGAVANVLCQFITSLRE